MPFTEEDETTTQQPSAQEEAERLLAEGNIVEAEGLYRALAEAQPENPQWAERAEEIRAMREGRAPVLVRIIRAVE